MSAQSFEAILDGIAAKDDKAEWGFSFGQTSAGFWTVLSGIGGAEAGDAPRQPASRYERSGETIRQRVAEPPAPPAPPSIDPRDIRRDLGLANALTPKDLMLCRRAFARANHPDCAPLAFREQANIRMQIANRLVDEALARLRPGTGAQAQG
ncbi:hypothetical protein [Jiella sp. M17.18]|uniref:hypothetical protein n=1 Tax=Jiella sp. M17.18 TaxID=3234247 RepID=UPI0034DE6BAA